MEICAIAIAFLMAVVQLDDGVPVVVYPIQACRLVMQVAGVKAMIVGCDGDVMPEGRFV